MSSQFEVNSWASRMICVRPYFHNVKGLTCGREKDNIFALMDDSLLEGRNFFQPLFNASICGATGVANCFTLSISQTSLSFCDSDFMKTIGVGPVGE